MKLIAFEIQNYRSIARSGEVEVGHTTTLVGRNESGKSNLLIALHSMNPAGGRRDLSPIKDFPRSRRLSECTKETEVVKTTWELNAEEQSYLVGAFPRAKGVNNVVIRRHYGTANVPIEFVDLKPIDHSPTNISERVRKIATVIREAADKLEAEPAQQLRTATNIFEAALSSQEEPVQWSAVAAPALAQFRKALVAAAFAPEPREDGLLAELENEAAAIAKDAPAMNAATDWIRGRIPTFIYIADYPELVGHQNIREYLERKKANPPRLTKADHSFEKMCRVADLDPQQLQNLHDQQDHETRNQLTNRASAIVTSEVRRLWKDRQLKVRFSPDADHLDTFISDPNTVYDVEVNLDERSRGLKWFFSFYITFSADTKGGGSAENAILLLDEPGLHLHAAGQGDLLAHLSKDFKNQVIYTTHSPFMVPTDNLDSIRTVNIDQDAGTTVSKIPTGDAKTLFPIQAALGYYLVQTLFVGPNNLVVEGVTDFWILSSVSEYLVSIGKTGVPNELTLTPAGGAPKVPYMVALLSSERLNVFALLDDEKSGRAVRDELVKAKLIRDDNVIFVSDAFHPKKPAEADIEDVLGSDIYDALVQESYKAELKGKALNLNNKIPRIVKRYEEGFSAIGMEFHKTRPARLLLEKMAKEPGTIVTPAVSERFERLFGCIRTCFEKQRARAAEPFR